MSTGHAHLRVEGSIINPTGHLKQILVLLFQKLGVGHDTQNPVPFVYGVSVGQMQVELTEFQVVPF